jgi:hypothetical protein
VTQEDLESIYGDQDNAVAISLLTDFVSDLIVKYKEYCITAYELISISKLLYILEKYKEVEFEGSFSMEAGIKYEDGSSYYYTLSIDSSKEIVLSQDGYQTSNHGGDSFGTEYYNSLNSPVISEVRSKISTWINHFKCHSYLNYTLDISEDIEFLESAMIYEEPEEENDD